MLRVIVPGLLGLSFLVVSVGVSSAGDLKAIAARKEVALQKLQGQVKDAIERSRTLNTRDAGFLLESMMREVKAADLLESDRTPLVTHLQIRIRAVNQGAQAKKASDDPRPVGQPPTLTKPVAVDPPSKSPSSVAKDFMTQPKAAAQMYHDLIREREKRNVGLSLGEKLPPIPGESGIAFPPDWKPRPDFVSQKLTPREVKLLKTLKSTMSAKYEEKSFKAVLQDLEERTGLSLIVDPNSERDINLDYDDPITVKIEKATVRTVLKIVLGQKGLTYIIKEGNIQVMTPKRAGEHTVIRAYQVGDLLGLQPDMIFPPQIGQLQMMQNAQQLINLIQMSTDPNYWQPNGPGSIIFYPPTKTLLIRASSEMHYQLASPGMFGR